MLNKRIIDVCGTKKELANRMKVSDKTISYKLNGVGGFRQTDIIHMIEILDITQSDVQKYFFTEKVQ